MISTKKNIKSIVSDFRIDHMMRYSLFVPRLYNLCRSLGFKAGNIMPSRAFCSDENQGFPIILIAKHFGTFPFNHGRVGGIVATDRHGPHAQHGKDMVIIQASHVGYDPTTETFGSYCRLQTTNKNNTTSCGKIDDVIQWYLEEYQFAQDNIYLGREGDLRTITIDNQLLVGTRKEGVFLDLEKIILIENGQKKLIKVLSTSRVFVVSEEFCKLLPDTMWSAEKSVNIDHHLGPDMFVFKRDINTINEGQNHLENNLLKSMPWIVTAPAPLLIAAQINTQVEFDRTFRTIKKAHEYQGKNLIFISCLNIDISPQEGQLFPLTKCVPWAAYIQNDDGSSYTLEQSDIVGQLIQQSIENNEQIDMEAAIQQMIDASEIRVAF